VARTSESEAPPPREQAHALQVGIIGALIDEEDEIVDWIGEAVEVELRATEARDFTRNDHAEPTEPKRERPKWPAMLNTEVERLMEQFKRRYVGSDDDEKKMELYWPPKSEIRHVQKYRIECDRRIRYEKLALGDTVANWLERISRQKGEEWHWLVRNWERVDEATRLRASPSPQACGRACAWTATDTTGQPSRSTHPHHHRSQRRSAS
jgi:hypothetical protein